MKVTAQAVLDFWFKELGAKQHFEVDLALDKAIEERFGETLNKAKVGELYIWRDTAEGRLAEIIVLDQFSRNVFRDSAQAFAQDAIALILAQEAVNNNVHAQLSKAEQAFLFMPYMHSESKIIHEQALILFQQLNVETNLSFEIRHKKIIDRFGRYPHRNKILGRQSTKEEIEFLKQPGSSF